jgi:hypothetical protein
VESHAEDEVVNWSEESTKVEVFRSDFEAWCRHTVPQGQVLFIKLLPFHANSYSKDEVKPPKMDPDYAIECNDEGLPLFPSLDLNNDGALSVRCVLQAYFGYVWGRSASSKAFSI